MKSLFTCLLQLLSIIVLMGQPAEKMSYQAVIRDPSQQLVRERSIGIRVSILKGSETGMVVFQETYNPNPISNQNGLVTLEIGGGVAITGTFENIDWTVGPFFLKTEYDLDGGTSYSIAGTMQILSVPYSLYAKKAGKVDHLQLGDIEGVDVLGAQPGQVLKWDGFEWKPSTDISNGGTADNWGSQYVETEIDIAGIGTEANPLTIARQGALTGQLLKWTGSSWEPEDDDDGQTIDLNGYELTISNGNMVELPEPPVYTAGSGISIQNDVISNTGDGDETNELQTLSIAGNVLSLSDQGGSVTIPSDLNGTNNRIVKFDGQQKGINSGIRESDDANVAIGAAPDPSVKFLVETAGQDGIRASVSGTLKSAIDAYSENGYAIFAESANAGAIYAKSLGVGSYFENMGGFAINSYSEKGIISVTNSGENAITAQGGDIWMIGGSLFNGASNPSYKIHLSTNSAAKPTSSSWTVASDARLKKDVSNYTQGLADILKIRPVQFTYTGEAGLPEETGVGVLAQELQAIAPYMVHDWTYKETKESEGTTYLGVDNGGMTYMLINAVKELHAEIENLKFEIQELRKAK
jgi:hypothetical protein